MKITNADGKQTIDNKSLGSPPGCAACARWLTRGAASLLILLPALLWPHSACGQGVLINGANQDGTIFPAGDSDGWTFSANAGDNIVLRGARLNSSNIFNVWMRLYGPDAVLIAEAGYAELVT